MSAFICRAASVFGAMLPLFQNDTGAQLVGHVMSAAMKGLLASPLVKDPQFSLEKIVRHVPQLEHLHKLLTNLTSVALTELVKTMVKEPEKILRIVMSPNPAESFCRDFTKNAELKTILCNLNATKLGNQLQSYLATDMLVAQIMLKVTALFSHPAFQVTSERGGGQRGVGARLSRRRPEVT